MEFYVGIDGGGTKTAAAIFNAQGKLVGSGEGGPSTYGVTPAVTFEQSIATAIASAVAAAEQASGLAPDRFSAAFLGLGNVVSELDRSEVRKIAARLIPAPVERIGVDHDCRVALAGGLSGRPGLVLIAGTGTSSFGMTADGRSWRSGGWGPLIDDEGSGYWLGLQAIRAAVLAYDGRGPESLLLEMIREAFRLRDINDLMNRLYAVGISRTEIAALAPRVFEAANQGDGVALALIRQGCAAMADAVLAVARRLDLDQHPVELAVVGGLVEAGETLFAPLVEAVRARLPQCDTHLAELSPVAGAGLLALQLGGLELSAAVLAEAHQSFRKVVAG